MPQPKEEQVRLIRQKSKQAIALAMEGRWREAVEANKGIIADFPSDVDAYNRLGRAYMELGESLLAREAYGRAKELDPFNTIAEKNLRRLSHLRETSPSVEGGFHRVEPQVFIEETGKAGVVSLYRLAPKEVLAGVDAGDKVNLKIVGSSLMVEDMKLRYLGQVEPRYSQRLIRLMVGGNRYTATVVSSSEDMMAIIIRETYQYPSQEGQLSFPSKGFGSLRPYVSDKIIRRRIEYDEAAVREPGYVMTSEDEAELLSDEPTDEISEEEEPEV
jgi:tetratricopeptide (TPR) repeat protein